MARQVFRNFGKYLVEFLRFEKMGDNYINRKVRIVGAENLKEALGLKKGAILFSAHLGNWEWGGALIAHLGFPIYAIVLEHKHKKINDFFVRQRALKGMGSIPLGGSVRAALKHLDNNDSIAILSDRDFSNNSVGVSFFGKEAYLPIGTAIFALRRRCPLVPCFIVREKGNKHTFYIEKPIEYTLSGTKEANIKEIVQKTANVLERYIKQYPDQWFIFDDPWRKKITA
jgi:KDO2-lipid IV(A) lauroyltransferase